MLRAVQVYRGFREQAGQIKAYPNLSGFSSRKVMQMTHLHVSAEARSIAEKYKRLKELSVLQNTVKIPDYLSTTGRKQLYVYYKKPHTIVADTLGANDAFEEPELKVDRFMTIDQPLDYLLDVKVRVVEVLGNLKSANNFEHYLRDSILKTPKTLENLFYSSVLISPLVGMCLVTGDQLWIPVCWVSLLLTATTRRIIQDIPVLDNDGYFARMLQIKKYKGLLEEINALLGEEPNHTRDPRPRIDCVDKDNRTVHVYDSSLVLGSKKVTVNKASTVRQSLL